MFTVRFHLKKEPDIPWFKFVYPDLNFDGNMYLDGCEGFISKINLVFNETDNINEITFDTSDNFLQAWENRTNLDFYKVRAEYYIENDIEIITTYPT